MYLSRNKKNNVYSCKPQFYYIKVGFKEVKIIKVCFRDELHFCAPNFEEVGGAYCFWVVRPFVHHAFSCKHDILIII